MDFEKIKTKEVENLQKEIAEEVVEEINLAGKSKKEWIRAILVKKNDKPLSGKYTFITKNPVTVEYIPGCKKVDFLMSSLLGLTQKNELNASVYPDKSIKFS
jgi:hypothetical protein